jgi:hypothetical protein
MYKALHHPLVWEEGAEYEDGIGSKVTRYGIWLVMADADNTLNVPKAVRDGFRAWADAEAERVRQALSEARKGSGEALAKYREQAKENEGLAKQATAMQTKIQNMLAQGLIDQETADAILAGESA